MGSLLEEIKIIRNMLEFVIEQVIGVEEPEEWEKILIEKALSEESLSEEELWEALDSE